MSEPNRDPPRWLESGFVSEELARELVAYGAQAPAAASKARMLGQLTAHAVEAAPAATQSAALVKAKLFIAAAAILAGAMGLLQLRQPPAAVMRALEPPRSGPTRVAPLAQTTLALEPVIEAAPRAGPTTEPVLHVPRVERHRRAAQRGGEPRPEAAPPVSGAQPDVLAELTMLARARRALLNDPARALELSEAHARSYPHGTFDEEREVLAIESLVKLGRTDEARLRVRAFRVRFPRSAQNEHLANLIAKSSE